MDEDVDFKNCIHPTRTIQIFRKRVCINAIKSQNTRKLNIKTVYRATGTKENEKNNEAEVFNTVDEHRKHLKCN